MAELPSAAMRLKMAVVRDVEVATFVDWVGSSTKFRTLRNLSTVEYFEFDRFIVLVTRIPEFSGVAVVDFSSVFEKDAALQLLSEADNLISWLQLIA